jgi:hypothetical protein
LSCRAVFGSHLGHETGWSREYAETQWGQLDDYKQSDYPSVTAYALSGSATFIQQTLALIPLKPALVLAAVQLNHKPWRAVDSPEWLWLRLSHPQSGGVTSGKFWCGVRPAPAEGAFEVRCLASRRRLRNLLAPLVNGSTSEPPTDPEACYEQTVKVRNVLHPGCYLPITDPRVKVLAPCIFSPSKWVARPLTVRELAGCCDVQDAVVKRLPDLPVTRVSLGDMPFAVNAPAKLLGNFVDSLSEHYPSCLLRNPTTLQTGTLGDQPRVPAIQLGDAYAVEPRPAEKLGGHSSAYLDHEGPSRTPKLTCVMVTEDEGGSSAMHETADQFADECDPAVLFGRNKAAKNDNAEINHDY